jgi:hypothetical protein
MKSLASEGLPWEAWMRLAGGRRGGVHFRGGSVSCRELRILENLALALSLPMLAILPLALAGWPRAQDIALIYAAAAIPAIAALMILGWRWSRLRVADGGLGIGWRTVPWEDIEGVEAKMELTVRTDADGLHALIHGPIIVHGCASPHEIPIPRPNILIMEGKVMLRIRYRGGEALAEIPLDKYVWFQDALSRAVGRRGRRPGWYEALMDITLY